MDTNGSSGLSWAGSLTTLAGAWLVLSPYFFSNFSLSGAALWAQVIAGAVLLIAGLSDFAVRSVWPSWASAIVGLWLIVTPFTYNVADPSKWNEVIAGLVVIVMAVVGGQTVSRLQHATK